MSRHLVIVDAGPLIALARIDALHLLRRLFGRACITSTVRSEILPDGITFPETSLLSRVLAEGWIDVVKEPTDNWRPLNPGIGPGETSAIHLACHARTAGDNPLLLIDDRAGRLEAGRQGIALLGTAALIGLARKEGLVAAARPLLEQLTQVGYFLGKSVIEVVLTDLGE